jgi:bifunctional DNA-binding transcriptional regulator/antitoxin component of YhaV-PrlF toxin-antitoxin module
MVKFKVKANASGQYYFPKEVRQELGDELTLICNTKAAIVFSDDLMLQNVLESIEIIMKDLKHRLQLQKDK